MPRASSWSSPGPVAVSMPSMASSVRRDAAATVAVLMGPMELRKGRSYALAFMLRLHGGADAAA